MMVIKMESGDFELREEKRREELQNTLHITNVPLIFMHSHDRPNQSLIFKWLYPPQTHAWRYTHAQQKGQNNLTSVGLN